MIFRLTLIILSVVLWNSHLLGQFKKRTSPKSEVVIPSNLIVNEKVSILKNKKRSQAPSPWSDYQALKLSDKKTKILRGRNYRENGTPSWIVGNLESTVKSQFNIATESQNYLNQASSMMQIKNPSQAFKNIDTWEDDLDQVHLKMQQTYKGVPILGSEIILHAKEKEIYALNGSYLSDDEIQISNSEVINQKNAENIISERRKNIKVDLGKEKHPFGSSFKQWQSDKVLYMHEGSLKYAWHIEVFPNFAEREVHIIDAETGETLDQYSKICRLHNHHEDCTSDHHSSASSVIKDGTAVAFANDLFGQGREVGTYQVGNNYYMIDASRDMFRADLSDMPNDPTGVIWTINAFDTAPQNDNFEYDHFISQNNRFDNDEEAVSAQYNASLAYEYFKNFHNRESINGRGSDIISFVNVADEDGSSMGNAFWNGHAIFYGAGDSAFRNLGRGLDVAGHELTHGVVQNTANLDYVGESGALNESYADIFGAMIEREDWAIGEDVVRTEVFPSGALRSLFDPHNGAAIGDIQGGWQPKHVSNQFRGREDNGGVHINSGIPNHAYYLFATEVGIEMAEAVYYRALTTYLTRSSQFGDHRLAVEQAASDLGDASVVSAARSSFDAVGIVASESQNYQQDVGTNPGQDFILYVPDDQSKAILRDAAGNVLADPLIDRAIISKPSIADDGSELVYIGQDNKMYYVFIDWSTNSVQETVLQEDPIWRNVVISKDGYRLAALFEQQPDQDENRIWVYDFDLGQSKIFDLYNPTFTEGISTGEVLYADAIEFDFSGDVILYDAINETSNSSGIVLDYWDIGFIEVWDENENTWADGRVRKLFSALPEGSSVGNPSYSKNSPYIIALDLFDEDGHQILGVNTETSEVGIIYENTGLGYPNYSTDDTQLLFDAPGDQGIQLGILNLQPDKINGVDGTASLLEDRSRWGNWFRNGQRDLNTADDDISFDTPELQVSPNPANSFLQLTLSDQGRQNGIIQIYNASGMLIRQVNSKSLTDVTLDIQSLQDGSYYLLVHTKDKTYGHKFMKIQ